MDVQRCQVVTFNCCLSTWVNGAFARSARLADAFYSSIPHSDVDVVCLQELVMDFPGVTSRFIHHKYHTKPLTSAWYTANFRPWPSGLCIVSRWPIVEEDGHIFSGPSYHWEKLMAKGILYAKIKLPNNDDSYLHMFNTHLQAWTNETAAENRKQQMQEISTFMQRKLVMMNMERDFVLCGLDGNLDLFEHARQVKAMFRDANLKVIKPQTPMFSFDPAQNLLGATDDPNEYKLRDMPAAALSQTASPISHEKTNFPKQLIDFFAILRHQKKAIHIRSHNVIPIQTVSPFLITMNLNRQISLRTVSDHFAVKLQFDFNCVSAPQQQQKPLLLALEKPQQHIPPTPRKQTVHFGWVMTAVFIFIVVFLIIFWLLLFLFS